MGEQTSAQKLDPAWVDEFAERWGNAWNAHDPAQVLELFTDDIVYDDSAWPKTMRGKADVREFLDHGWRAFPYLTFELIAGPHIAGDGPRAAYWWKATATHQGPIDPPGIPPPANTSNSTASTSTNTATAKSPNYGSSST
ncbi:nuclear transport factor 2 family protein (plasmid) [Rhodococcus opacus]|uniref:nuclear transport factor 2 family protein n=1 Tax=Rhodococcus opacus TaxID=37919 RepID=UPI0034D1B856